MWLEVWELKKDLFGTNHRNFSSEWFYHTTNRNDKGFSKEKVLKKAKYYPPNWKQ